MNHKAIIKAINRHVKKAQVFQGGKQYGVDYATWHTCYPQMSAVFSQCAEVLTGRKGRFLPRF